MPENLALYILVGLFIPGVSFILKLIFDRINRNEKELKEFRKEVDDKICTNYDLIRSEYKELTAIMELNKQEVLKNITAISEKTVSLTQCDLKQELWNERFNGMMGKFDSYLAQNEKEHSQVVDALTRNASAQTQQMVDLSERITDLSECVRELQHGDKC